jgi:hypothetical protein
VPNTNQAILARVYATETGGAIEEEALRSDQPFDIVVEAEAGNNVFNAGGTYKVQMVLTDYTQNMTTANTQTISGTFGPADANWTAQELQHRFVIPAQGAARNDHAYRAFAVLQVGNVDPIVDFEEGEVFVITPQ